jgi:mRNA interferase RelE/StbE
LVWTIKYTESSLRQLKKLDKPVAQLVLDYMDERIAVLADPRAAGKNLVGPRMGSYWRYRIGDVRVICDLQDNALLILVVEVGHRREVNRTK